MPSRLKVVRGNPGKRRIKPGVEPKVAIPTCPSWVSADGKREWRRVARALYELGLLTELDRGGLVVYITAWALLEKAEPEIRKGGAVITLVNKAGEKYPKASPWVKIARDASKQMLAAAIEFGMTPSARSRVTATPPEPEPDPFSIYEGGKNKPKDGA